jgi:hypothetical protein
MKSKIGIGCFYDVESSQELAVMKYQHKELTISFNCSCYLFFHRCISFYYEIIIQIRLHALEGHFDEKCSNNVPWI